MNIRNEMIKYQEMQVPAYGIGEVNKKNLSIQFH